MTSEHYHILYKIYRLAFVLHGMESGYFICSNSNIYCSDVFVLMYDIQR